MSPWGHSTQPHHQESPPMVSKNNAGPCSQDFPRSGSMRMKNGADNTSLALNKNVGSLSNHLDRKSVYTSHQTLLKPIACELFEFTYREVSRVITSTPTAHYALKPARISTQRWSSRMPRHWGNAAYRGHDSGLFDRCTYLRPSFLRQMLSLSAPQASYISLYAIVLRGSWRCGDCLFRLKRR